jgi:hypothetical protein
MGGNGPPVRDSPGSTPSAAGASTAAAGSVALLPGCREGVSLPAGDVGPGNVASPPPAAGLPVGGTGVTASTAWPDGGIMSIRTVVLGGSTRGQDTALSAADAVGPPGAAGRPSGADPIVGPAGTSSPPRTATPVPIGSRTPPRPLEPTGSAGTSMSGACVDHRADDTLDPYAVTGRAAPGGWSPATEVPPSGPVAGRAVLTRAIPSGANAGGAGGGTGTGGTVPESGGTAEPPADGAAPDGAPAVPVQTRRAARSIPKGNAAAPSTTAGEGRWGSGQVTAGGKTSMFSASPPFRGQRPPASSGRIRWGLPARPA